MNILNIFLCPVSTVRIQYAFSMYSVFVHAYMNVVYYGRYGKQ